MEKLEARVVQEEQGRQQAIDRAAADAARAAQLQAEVERSHGEAHVLSVDSAAVPPEGCWEGRCEARVVQERFEPCLGHLRVG